MSPIISIIIPVYNSGNYLPETLESVRNYTGKNIYEIIIVNDGSTDNRTLELLNLLHNEGYTIIHQENKGPAAARNNGVERSRGKYLLFLDSDNRIKPSYIDKGIEILNKDERVGVVYGNPHFFGDAQEPPFETVRFDMYVLLTKNYIDMCSVVRKKVWEDLGGLDENGIIIGHEDWDFWIRAAAAGWKFHHVDEVLFDYRISSSSLVKQALQVDKHKQMLRYLYSKNLDIFLQHYLLLHQKWELYQQDQQKPFMSFMKYCYKKYFKPFRKAV